MLRRITILSIHSLFDTRIANHLASLVDAGWSVTYINWSRRVPMPDLPQLRRVNLIQRDADPLIGYSPLRLMRMLGWFIRQTRLYPAHIYHIHDLFLMPIVPLLPGKVVYDSHENYEAFGGRVGQFARMCRAFILPRVAGVVATSEASLPTRRRPWVLVPNYQRLAQFGTAHPNSYPVDANRVVRIIYFGTLSSDDREVGLLLDVMERCLECVPEVCCEIGGILAGMEASIHQQRLDQLVDRFGDRFRWYGPMRRDLVIERTKSADIGLIFIKPGTHAFGGSWNKIYEYLACGTAIISTSGFDAEQAVREAGAGLMFEPGTDAETIATALIALVQNRSRLGTMQKASANLGRKFDWCNVAPRYIELYNRLSPMRACTQHGSAEHNAAM